VSNGKKSFVIKVLIILFGHLWEVELPYRYIFAFKFTLRSQQPDSVPIICQRVSTTLAKLVAKFASGVVVTCGKFAAGVVDTGGNFGVGVVDTGVVDTGGVP
jgi:hypothetical protein